MLKHLIPLFLLLFLFEGCTPDDFHNDSRVFNEFGWTYADSLRFDFAIADTAKRYNLFIKVHHSSEYDFENLYVKFSTLFPNAQKAFNGSNRVDQMTSLKLARVDGAWLGTCSGEICTYEIPIQLNAFFPESGDYSLLIQQYMRIDSLKDIRGIDFYIRENKL